MSASTASPRRRFGRPGSGSPADDGPRATFRQLLPYLLEHRRVLSWVIVISVLGALASLAQPLLVSQVIGIVEEGGDLAPVVALLVALRDLHDSGVAVHAPGFDRRVEEPVPGALALTPELRCIVVEGNYLLLDGGGWQRVAPLLDLTVGVVLDEATRHERLIARHIAFGKSPEAARAWALGPDQANAALIAPTLARADVLLAAE